MDEMRVSEIGLSLSLRLHLVTRSAEGANRATGKRKRRCKYGTSMAQVWHKYPCGSSQHGDWFIIFLTVVRAGWS